MQREETLRGDMTGHDESHLCSLRVVSPVGTEQPVLCPDHLPLQNQIMRGTKSNLCFLDNECFEIQTTGGRGRGH